MTAKSDKPRPALRGAAPLRHAASLAVTLALNGGLVLALVAWSGHRRSEARAVIRAVPLTVAPAEAVPADLGSARPPEEPAAVEPVAPPALPPLPRPALAPPSPSLAAPSPIEITAASRLDVPAYAARAAAPAAIRPVAPPPVPTPRPKAGRGDLTRGPVLRARPDLSAYYPRRALLSGVTGSTRIRLTISAAGDVTAVEIVSSEPAGVFEHAARRVGRVLRFRPALRAGVAVRSVVSLNLFWKVE